MIYNDYTQIEKIEFAHPEFMSADAEQKAIDLFNEIERERDEIYSLREEANNREMALRYKEEAWRTLKDQMFITYRTFEKDEIKNSPNICFNMSAEINKNLH